MFVCLCVIVPLVKLIWEWSVTENSIQYSKIEGLCSKVKTVLYSTVQELET